MAPELARGAHGFLHHGEARIAQREFFLPAKQQQNPDDPPRYGKRQPQHLRPHEGHACSRWGGTAPPAASWLRRLRRSAKRRIASVRLSSVANSSASTPAFRKEARTSASRRSATAAKRLRHRRSWVATSTWSPVSASCITTTPRSGSSISRRS